MNQQGVRLNFDASTVEPTAAFEALPAGDYVVCLVAAVPTETKLRTGHYLKMDFVVQEGQFRGRHIFDNFNLWNASQQATEIAWRQLSGLCHAAGVLRVEFVEQLFNIPVIAKLGMSEDPQYGMQNTIKAFVTAHGAAMAGAPAGFANPPGFTTVPPASAPASPPWGNNAPAAPAAAPQAQAPASGPSWGAQHTPPAQQATAPAPAQQPAGAGAPPWGPAPTAPAAEPGSDLPPWAR